METLFQYLSFLVLLLQGANPPKVHNDDTGYEIAQMTWIFHINLKNYQSTDFKRTFDQSYTENVR